MSLLSLRTLLSGRFCRSAHEICGHLTNSESRTRKNDAVTRTGRTQEVARGSGQKGIAMLVLTRKSGESIQIAGNIRITVSEVIGGRVRFAIDAPDHVRVMRKEVLPQINIRPATSAGAPEAKRR